MRTERRTKTTRTSLRRHRMWSEADFAYLREKGYSLTEIEAIWDRDLERGCDCPQKHLVSAFWAILDD